MIEEYNYILRLLTEGYTEKEMELSDTELKLAEVDYNYKDLHENTQKLASLCSLYKINPDIIFYLDQDTLNYVLKNKCKVPRVVDDLMDIDMLLKAKKAVNEQISKYKQTKVDKDKQIVLDCNILRLEIMEMHFEKQLRDRL
jgi:hypothetical protein